MKRAFWIVFLVVVIGVLSISSPIWFPGVSKEQTAEILASDHKYGGRALTKAKWHGESLIPFLKESTNNFLDVNYSSAMHIIIYANELNREIAISLANDLYKSNNLFSKLAAVNILAERRPKHIETYTAFITRVLEDAEPNLPEEEYLKFYYVKLAKRAREYMEN